MEDKQLEKALETSLDKSFKDNELNDIMNEIESLEKEFSTTAKEKDLSLKEAAGNSLQDIIDAEVSSMEEVAQEAIDETPTMEVIEEAIEEPIMETPTMEVVEEAIEEPIMETPTMEIVEEEYDEEPAFSAAELAEIEETTFEEEENVVAMSPVSKSSGSSVDFNASGSMDLNVNFQVAGETATLKVVNGGLIINMNGVDITINEESGCSVTMDGGINFSVPLGASKKAA